jgi:polar amino acid transport system permease protein
VGLIGKFLPLLLRGALVTVEVTAVSAVLALGMSFAGGLGRLSRHRLLRWIAGTYIELFRGTSLLVQMFWVFYVFPTFGLTLSPFTAGVAVLGLNLGAYGAEVVRGGIQAVPEGQIDAAVALDFGAGQRFRRIVLPQAVPLMLPPFGNLLIVLLKASSLVSFITLPDLTFNAESLRSASGHTLLIYSMVLVMYFLMSSVITVGMRTVEARVGLRYGARLRRESKVLADPLGRAP